MATRVTCPFCGARLRVGEKFAGASFACPACHTQVVMPADSVEESVGTPSFKNTGVAATPPDPPPNASRSVTTHPPTSVQEANKVPSNASGQADSQSTHRPLLVAILVAIIACTLAIAALAVVLLRKTPGSSIDAASRDNAANPVAAVTAAAPTVESKPSVSPPGALYSKFSPSVVFLTAVNSKGTGFKIGSGFFISDDLFGSGRYSEATATLNDMYAEDGRPKVRGRYVLTNFHVIRGAVSVTVETQAGEKAECHNVVAEDALADLAVIYVWLPESVTASHVPLADHDEEVGATVYAIGSPQGLRDTLSTGIVSAGRREVRPGVWFIQTTAAISGGSSGGPLLDTLGNAVGVIVASRTEGQSLNFAVPVMAVRGMASRLPKPRKMWEGACSGKQEESLFDSLDTHAFLLARSQAAGDVNKAELSAIKRFLTLSYSEDVARDTIAKSRELLQNIPPEFAFLVEYRIAQCYERLLFQRGARGSSAAISAGEVADDAEAIEALTRCLSKKAEFAAAHELMAVYLSRIGRNGEAAKYADRLVVLLPHSARAFAMRADILSAMDRTSDSIRDYEQSLDIDSTDESVWLSLGNELVGVSEHERAVACYEKAIEAGLSSVIGYFSIGNAMQKNGQYGKAIAAYRKSLASVGLAQNDPFADNIRERIGQCEAALLK